MSLDPCHHTHALVEGLCRSQLPHLSCGTGAWRGLIKIPSQTIGFAKLVKTNRAIIKFIVGDLRQKVQTDFLRFSNSRFSDLWVLDGFCVVEGGLPELKV